MLCIKEIIPVERLFFYKTGQNSGWLINPAEIWLLPADFDIFA
jgi:hypothetical protein